MLGKALRLWHLGLHPKLQTLFQGPSWIKERDMSTSAYYGSLPAANSLLDSELCNNLVALECAGLETRYELQKEILKKTCMYIY
jgi:hypothetical protein